MSGSLSHGGEKNKKDRNIIITNDILSVQKKFDAKDLRYVVKFNKNLLKNEINNSVSVLQDILESIFYSIDPDLSFSSFYSLEEYLKKNDVCNYHTATNFIKAIGLQIDMLRTKKLSILAISLKDVWIVNDKFFVFMGNPNLHNFGIIPYNYKYNIDVTEYIQKGFKTNNFIAPEITKLINSSSDTTGDTNNRQDRYIFHRNVSNFSLGKILIVMLFGSNNEKQISFEKAQQIMEPIINTKIYFYALRCIDPDPIMRANLYL